MKSFIRFVLLTLFACSLSGLAGAAEPLPAAEPKPVVPQVAAPVADGKTPAPLPVAPLNLLAPLQKTPEALTAQKAMRLGHVDLMRINNESEFGKAGLKQLENKKKKLQAQIESKRKQLEKMRSDIEAKIKSLSPAQREAKSREFQKKVEEFQKFGQNSENELQTLQQGLGSALFDKIERACAEYGKSNGLALVVIKRELLYLDSTVEAVDVTDAVVKMLNEKEPKK
jgi:outer membrane protein